ncbi:MAG: hypothetical protein JOY71_12735 [Acetobacteraceae bacterium]|nr:hypothetical protein [Acetobacteraceae bacterium]
MLGLAKIARYLTAASFFIGLGSVGAAAEALSDCEQAAAIAERDEGLPPGILAAIGRVESGRRDPQTGRLAPWPWTIDANGAGAFLPTREAAITQVQVLRASGVQSIDIGCFQVNLLHHPSAFASLEQGFDPVANARYAARFLVLLRERTGNWENAIMNYHSADPDRGGPYRDRVLAGWTGVPDQQARPRLANAGSETFGIRIWTPVQAAPGVVVMRSTTARLPAIISPPG